MCATAQGATRTVYAGPFVRADAQAFQQALGDANAYFVNQVTIRQGDRVRWLNRGFHTITFAPPGPTPGLIVPDTSTPLANVLDAANQPFWFNGQPRLILNPDAVAKKGGPIFRRGRLYNSGLPLSEGPPRPYTLRFNRTGTFKYFCIVHPGMEGSVKVVGKKKRIPPAASVRREAMRQEKSVLRRVQAASTGQGANQPANVIQAGNDTKSVTVFKFFPAQATVKAGATVTLRMSRRTTEVHTFSFGPIGTEQAPEYLLQIAAGGFAPTPEGSIAIDPRILFQSEPPPAGIPTHTGATQHGNGFFNSGALDADDASAAIPSSLQVRFNTPGTYAYICLIHPFMQGQVTVTA
jgi:plastocyanin